MTFDDHHNALLECGASEACENPNPAVAERTVCWSPQRATVARRWEKRVAAVAVDADLAFPAIFSKRYALGCPNWAALLMRYFESPWEIKLGWCHGPAQQVLRTKLEWNVPLGPPKQLYLSFCRQGNCGKIEFWPTRSGPWLIISTVQGWFRVDSMAVVVAAQHCASNDRQTAEEQTLEWRKTKIPN